MAVELFKIVNAKIQRGEVANLALPLPSIYPCIEMYVPIKVIAATKKGPTVLIFSTVLGDEYSGIEIINQLSKQLRDRLQSGTLINIPVLNPYGLTHFPHSLPDVHKSLDDYADNPGESFGGKLSAIFLEEIVSKADVIITLTSCGNEFEVLSGIVGDYKEISNILVKSKLPVFEKNVPKLNGFNSAIQKLNKELIIIEVGESSKIDRDAVKKIFIGIENILSALEMIEPEVIEKTEQLSNRLSDRYFNESLVNAPISGLFRSYVYPGEKVDEQQIIGIISDPYNLKEDVSVLARCNGTIRGISKSYIVYEGQKLFSIFDVEVNE